MKSEESERESVLALVASARKLLDPLTRLHTVATANNFLMEVEKALADAATASRQTALNALGQALILLNTTSTPEKAFLTPGKPPLTVGAHIDVMPALRLLQEAHEILKHRSEG